MTALQGGPEEWRETKKKEDREIKSHTLFGCDCHEDVEAGIWSSTFDTNVEFGIIK